MRKQKPIGAYNPRFNSIHDDPRRIFNTKFMHDIFSMRSHRVSAKKKQFSNLCICVSLCNHSKDFFYKTVRLSFVG